jgi:hypothetical protein
LANKIYKEFIEQDAPYELCLFENKKAPIRRILLENPEEITLSLFDDAKREIEWLMDPVFQRFQRSVDYQMYFCPQTPKPIYRSNSLVFDHIPIQKKTFSGTLFQLISSTKLKRKVSDDSDGLSSPFQEEKIEKTGSRGSLREINLKITSSLKNLKL